MNRRKYLDFVYGTRSDLAHGKLRNVPKLSTYALNQQYSELLRFVLDILEAWTPDYSEQERPQPASGTSAEANESR